MLHGHQILGWSQTLLLLGLTFGVSLLFESVGVATGWIYGPYHYTEILGQKFLGLLPYLIPVVWFMMTYPSYIIATRLLPSHGKVRAWRLGIAALGGLVMTTWDLAMDPMMFASGHWVWEVEGAYFGVPLQNFWGWWLTVFTTFTLFSWLGQVRPLEQASAPVGFERLAVWVYAITGLSSVLIGIQRGLGPPALVCLFAMLPWVIIGGKKRAT